MTTFNTTVVRGPFNVYVGVLGTAAPTPLTVGSLDAAWKKLGRGIRSQGDSGVVVSYKQKLDEWRGQSNVVQDVARSEEDVMIAFEAADISLEALSYALGGNQVVNTAAATGVPGKKKMFNFRGSEVIPLSLLVIGKSPYLSGGVSIFYVPKVFNQSDLDLAFTKTAPAMTKFEFKAGEGPNGTDTDGDLGYWEIVTAAALP